MASIPDPSTIADAEQLVLDLKNDTGSAASHARTMRQMNKLRCRLEQGPDALMHHSFPFLILPALKMMIDFGVFDTVPLEGSMSLVDVAAAVNLDAPILSRFLSIVLTQGIFKETAQGVFQHTPASSIFRNDQAASYYRLGTMQFPHWWKVSDYLKTHSASEAQDVTKSPYCWAQGKEGMTYYEAIEEDPVVSDTWHKAMIMVEMSQPISGMFPFHSMEAAVKAEPQRAFVVDIGGGRGNALVAMMQECGGTYGAKMILQDMREVLAGKDPVRIEKVENMPHNFWDEQPVKNAHIYYLRFVLHNNYDDRSRRILRHTVNAMGPSSRLLIGEMILPTSVGPDTDPFPFVMDLCMFMESGVERNEGQWQKLLGDVGLKIVKIWRHPDNPIQGTIEAKLRN